MLLKQRMAVLAAVLSGAGAVAPVAQAKFDNVTYPPLNAGQYVARHSGGGATDWSVIALATGGAIVAVGAGTAGTRRLVRRHAGVTSSSVS